MYRGEDDNLVPDSDRYKRHFPELLIAHMAKGFTFESFAGIAGVSISKLKGWLVEYPDFKEAADIGHARCLMFWEAVGRGGVLGKIRNFKEKTYVAIMQKLFNYTDKQETEHSGKIDIRLYIPHNGRDQAPVIHERESHADSIAVDVSPVIESRPHPEPLVLEGIGPAVCEGLLLEHAPLPGLGEGGLQQEEPGGRGES